MAEDSIITIDLSGDTELAAIFRSLPDRLIANVVKTGFRGPAKRIVSAARSLAPIESGLLKKELKVRTPRARKNFVSVVAGTGPKGWGGPAYYGYFQEHGYKIGKRPFKSHSTQEALESRLRSLQGFLGSSRSEQQQLSGPTPSQSVAGRAILGVLEAGRRAAGMSPISKRALEQRILKENKKRDRALKRVGEIQDELAKRRADKRRQIPPKWFVRRAFDANKAITRTEMRQELFAAIDKELAKDARRKPKIRVKK